MPRTSQYRKLLAEDANLARWYENLIRGSPVTAEVYLRRLGSFCKVHSLTPLLLAKREHREIENLLQDHLNSLEKQGRAPGYLASIMKTIRSWAEWNEKPLQRRIKIANRDATPTLEDEGVPSKEELKKVLYSDKTALRTRASICLIAFSGLRLETLGDYYGKDGLKVKDLAELGFVDKISFRKTPTMVRVRSNLSKARHQYFTFLPEEGCKIVAELLERRRQGGETLTPETPIIAASPSYDRRGRFKTPEGAANHITTSKISEHIRQSIRACNFKWRPYIFRSYFDTALMLAESKRLVSHAYQQFWMGHKGDIEAQYTTRKHRLPEEVVEDMRDAYRRAEEYITTSGTDESSEQRIRRAFKEQLLLVAGFKKDEVEKMDLASMSDEELQGAVRHRLLGVMANNGSRQRTIALGEVEGYLSQGWDYVATLPNGRAIVKVPF